MFFVLFFIFYFYFLFFILYIIFSTATLNTTRIPITSHYLIATNIFQPITPARKVPTSHDHYP